MKRFIIYCIVCLFITFNCMHAQSHVQTKWRFHNSGVASTSTVFASPSTSGNLIVVHLSWQNQARSVTAVTDSKGNTYTRINGPTNWFGTTYRSELWYAYNIIGGGAAITVTATLNAAATNFLQIYISEYSGISATNPLDQKRANIGSGNPCNSGTVTTLFTNELIYGAAIGASGALSVGTSFTARSVDNDNIIEDRNVAAIGTYSSTFSSVGGDWVAEIATFKSGTSLPIELLDFTASCAGDKAELNWQTATEKNNDYFTIERSTNGLDFTEINRVKGTGTSLTKKAYAYTDNNIDSETQYYYRLKQTDFDGGSKIFKIVSFDCEIKAPEFYTYSDDLNGQLILKINSPGEDNYTITISDMSGKTIYTAQKNTAKDDNSFLINISAFEPGLYLIKAISGGHYFTGKFSR